MAKKVEKEIQWLSQGNDLGRVIIESVLKHWSYIVTLLQPITNCI